MKIWSDKNGNLFARFWTRNAEIDDASLTIHGILPESIPEWVSGASPSDAWIPQAVRGEYEGWIKDEW